MNQDFVDNTVPAFTAAALTCSAEDFNKQVAELPRRVRRAAVLHDKRVADIERRIAQIESQITKK